MIPFLIAVLFAIVSTASPELPSAPEDTFSFAVIPDTQRYKWKGTRAEPESEAPVTNAVFDTYTKWIQANIEPQRIVFVSHVGDIVDRNVLAQWDVARNAMDRLHGRIPYRISVENHDMTRSGDSSLFQQYFPAPRYEGLAWYTGIFTPESDIAISGNNANSYQLFTGNGSEFVFLHLECNAPDDVLA